MPRYSETSNCSKPEVSPERRALARLRFRALIRRVLVNKFWLLQELTRINTLNFQIRVALHQDPKWRTPDQIKMISGLILKMRHLQRYGKFDVDTLAKYAVYRFSKPGEVIIRQNQQPNYVYCLVYGSVEMYTETAGMFSNLIESHVVQMHPGAIFGDMVILLDKLHFVTITTQVISEFLVFPRNIFIDVLHAKMYAHYSNVHAYIHEFRYFDGFDDRKISELCFYGRIVDYPKNDVLYAYEDVRDADMTSFLINGECDVIKVVGVNRDGQEKFDPYDPNGPLSNTSFRITSSMTVNSNILVNIHEAEHRKFEQRKFAPLAGGYMQFRGKEQKFLEAVKSQPSRVESTTSNASRRAIIKSTSCQHSNQRHTVNFKNPSKAMFKMTHICRRELRNAVDDGKEKIEYNPAALDHIFKTSRSEMETHFMKIATYQKLSCFNIGESMTNCNIVSKTPVCVLEIPKDLLTSQKSIVWEKLRRNLNRRLPHDTEVFDMFLNHRMHRLLRTRYLKPCMTTLDKCKSENHIQNIPYSIRIKSDYDFVDSCYRSDYDLNDSFTDDNESVQNVENY